METTQEEYDSALKKVMDYCLKHPGCGSFEIIVETKIKPEMVLRALCQLKNDGIVDLIK